VDPSRNTIRERVRARRLLDAVLAAFGCLALLLVVVSGASAVATGWAVQRVPAASVSPLSSVSCTSVGACTAVGGALVERSADNRWTRQNIPVPPGAVAVSLIGVACSSDSACIAVGGSSSTPEGGTDTPFTARWDGNRWSYQLVPDPARGPVRGIGFSAVSCTSSRACTAVGEGRLAGLGGRRLAFAERWDGTHWHVQPTALADGATLAGISCASRRSCVAVGARHGRAFVERWDGRRWSVQRFPAVPHGYLYAISCPSPSACFAVGSQASPAPLVARWDGRRWSIEPIPRSVSEWGSPQIDGISGVSCTSDTVCTAVGTAQDQAGVQEELALRRAGGRWTFQMPTANAHAAGIFPGNELDAVSCASLTRCVAVGSRLQDPVSVELGALVERWTAPIVPIVTG
jgi:hypothetical protein